VSDENEVFLSNIFAQNDGVILCVRVHAMGIYKVAAQ